MLGDALEQIRELADAPQVPWDRVQRYVCHVQSLAAEDGDKEAIDDFARQWSADSAVKQRVQLDQDAVVMTVLALRRDATGQLCHPRLRRDEGRWCFATDTPLAMCPAVLVTSLLLPADATLDAATLAKQSHRLEVGSGPPPTDALPHNLGFAHLAWQPGTGTVSGVGPVMFDTKHTLDQCPWSASSGPGLDSRIHRCWRTAAVWHSTVAEFERQAYLQYEYSPLYTQFWYEAQDRAAAARSRFLKTIRVAIKLDHLDQDLPTTTQLIASLNPREYTFANHGAL